MWSHTSNKKKGGEEMTAVTKYRYITLLNLTQAYARMTTEERAKWNARNRELQKKYDLTLLFGGDQATEPQKRVASSLSLKKVLTTSTSS